MWHMTSVGCPRGLGRAEVAVGILSRGHSRPDCVPVHPQNYGLCLPFREGESVEVERHFVVDPYPSKSSAGWVTGVSLSAPSDQLCEPKQVPQYSASVSCL